MKTLDLGRVAYAAALKIQEDLVEGIIRGEAEDTLILLEHPPVIVTGRAGGRGNILVSRARLAELGVDLVASNRGGDVTYHGPGQVVGYPVVHLAGPGRDLHAYLRRLEEGLIGALQDFGVRGERRRGLTGVWVGSRKIASVGIAVRKWVAYHGFALSVGNSPDGFSLIRPCGLPADAMTSVEEVTGRPVAERELKQALSVQVAKALHGIGAGC